MAQCGTTSKAGNTEIKRNKRVNGRNPPALLLHVPPAPPAGNEKSLLGMGWGDIAGTLGRVTRGQQAEDTLLEEQRGKQYRIPKV